MNCSKPGLPVHHQLLEFTQTHVHWVGDTIQPSHPLSSPSPPALKFPSIRVFSNESALRMRWPKYWSFSFSISSSNEYSRLFSFRMNCLDLLAVQGTLKSLLKHRSSKASILQHPAFFIVQLSHPYMITGLDRWVSFPRFHSWFQIEAGLKSRHSDSRAWAFISCSSQLYGLLCMLVRGEEHGGRERWMERGNGSQHFPQLVSSPGSIPPQPYALFHSLFIKMLTEMVCGCIT